MDNDIMLFDGVEYKMSELTKEQLLLVSHLQDLDLKLRKNRMEHDQFSVSYDYFMEKLRLVLAKPQE